MKKYVVIFNRETCDELGVCDEEIEFMYFNDFKACKEYLAGS